MRSVFPRRGWLLAALVVAGAATVVTVGRTVGSDHQDTPEVELSPRMDINNVYAFPGSSDDRIVLVMTTSSPITPAQSASSSFDPNLLYQLEDRQHRRRSRRPGAAVHVRGHGRESARTRARPGPSRTSSAHATRSSRVGTGNGGQVQHGVWLRQRHPGFRRLA